MHMTLESARRPVSLDLVAETPELSLSRLPEWPPMPMERHPAHDPSLLVAALEEIECRRVALETLLDADLLWRCLG